MRVVLVVLAMLMTVAHAANEDASGIHQEALMREFMMHTEESTPSNPSCTLVRQELIAINKYADEEGNVATIPMFRTDYHQSPCTPVAYPYEKEPGMGVNTRVTSERAPWHHGS